MEIAIGQPVLVADADGSAKVRATVVAFGEPDDAMEITIEGKPVKRDVAIVRYDEGEHEGLTGRVMYHLIEAAPEPS